MAITRPASWSAPALPATIVSVADIIINDNCEPSIGKPIRKKYLDKGNIFVEFRIQRQGAAFSPDGKSGALDAIESSYSSTITFVELVASEKSMSRLSTNSIINYMDTTIKNKLEDLAEKTLRKCSRLISHHKGFASETYFQEQQKHAAELPLEEDPSTSL